MAEMPSHSGSSMVQPAQADSTVQPAQGDSTVQPAKGRVMVKKNNRFKGMSEAEICAKGLPEYIRKNLDILIVGLNPGLYATYNGHHYSGYQDHLWFCMPAANLIPKNMKASQDRDLLDLGIGFTYIVGRTTKNRKELSIEEVRDGEKRLLRTVSEYAPKILMFNGMRIYEDIIGKKAPNLGLQTVRIHEDIIGKKAPNLDLEKMKFPGSKSTLVYLNPSSSTRLAQLPTVIAKLPYFKGLQYLREHICSGGSVDTLDLTLVTFPRALLPLPKRVNEEPGVEGDTVTAPRRKNNKRRSFPVETSSENESDANFKADASSTLPLGTSQPKRKRGRPKKNSIVARAVNASASADLTTAAATNAKSTASVASPTAAMPDTTPPETPSPTTSRGSYGANCKPTKPTSVITAESASTTAAPAALATLASASEEPMQFEHIGTGGGQTGNASKTLPLNQRVPFLVACLKATRFADLSASSKYFASPLSPEGVSSDSVSCTETNQLLQCSVKESVSTESHKENRASSTSPIVQAVSTPKCPLFKIDSGDYKKLMEGEYAKVTFPKAYIEEMEKNGEANWENKIECDE